MSLRSYSKPLAITHASLEGMWSGPIVVQEKVDGSQFSFGVVDGVPMLDLCYSEDSTAEVDMNVVMTGSGEFVEVQGTAEGEPFSRATLSAMTDLAWAGIEELIVLQKQIVEEG